MSARAFTRSPPAAIALGLLLTACTAPPSLDDGATEERALPAAVRVPVDANLGPLLRDEDTDGDGLLTADDRGDRRFLVRTAEHRDLLVHGAGPLVELHRQLEDARRAGRRHAELDPARLFASPYRQLVADVRSGYWDRVERRFDREALAGLARAGERRLHVPPSDPDGLTFYRALAEGTGLEVVPLAPGAPPGVLALPVGARYVAAGVSEWAQPGWESHFLVLALVRSGRVGLAQAVVDDLVYEVEHYGAVRAANHGRTLRAAQPPLLPATALAVYRALPPGDQARRWLARAIAAAMREHERVWDAPPRRTALGLSRYASARESGHDSYRLHGRATDLVPVSLNALLFAYERDIAVALEGPLAAMHEESEAGRWRERAEARRRRMLALLWDPERALFFDYDLRARRRLPYVSATTLYPMWAGALDPDRARRLAAAALAELEAPGGVRASTARSRGALGPGRPARGWDAPYGWAPHQVIAWAGLRRYGMHEDARRLAHRWAHMLAVDAVERGGRLSGSYDVDARRGRGDGGEAWTAASLRIASDLMTSAEERALDGAAPPEWLEP